MRQYTNEKMMLDHSCTFIGDNSQPICLTLKMVSSQVTPLQVCAGLTIFVFVFGLTGRNSLMKRTKYLKKRENETSYWENRQQKTNRVQWCHL